MGESFEKKLESLVCEVMEQYRERLGLRSDQPVPLEFGLGLSPNGVVVVGEGPGGSPDFHMTAREHLKYCRNYFRNNRHLGQWPTVWKHYAWILPSNPENNPEQFAHEASKLLTITNLSYMFEGIELRGLTGRWVEATIEVLRPKLVVTQGAKAWDWIRRRNRTVPLHGDAPVDCSISEIWGGNRRYNGNHHRYKVWWPRIQFQCDVMPVAHFSGKNHRNGLHVSQLAGQYRNAMLKGERSVEKGTNMACQGR